MATASGTESLTVIVKKVIDPVTFRAIVNREPACGAAIRTLQELENQVHEYYSTFSPVPGTNYIPKRHAIVAVRCPLDRKWYRARVADVYDRISGIHVQASLLDHDEVVAVDTNFVREIQRCFEDFPHQYRCLKLPGLVPTSLAYGPDTLMRPSISDVWDPSALTHVNHLIKVSSSARVTLLNETVDGDELVLLFLKVDKKEICVNHDLVNKGYATLNSDKFRESVTPQPDFDLDLPLEDQLLHLRSDLGRKISSLPPKSPSFGSSTPACLPTERPLNHSVKSCLNDSLAGHSQGARPSLERLSPGRGRGSILLLNSGATSTTSSISSRSSDGQSSSSLPPVRLPKTVSHLFSNVSSAVGGRTDSLVTASEPPTQLGSRVSVATSVAGSESDKSPTTLAHDIVPMTKRGIGRGRPVKSPNVAPPLGRGARLLASLMEQQPASAVGAMANAPTKSSSGGAAFTPKPAPGDRLEAPATNAFSNVKPLIEVLDCIQPMGMKPPTSATITTASRVDRGETMRANQAREVLQLANRSPERSVGNVRAFEKPVDKSATWSTERDSTTGSIGIEPVAELAAEGVGMACGRRVTAMSKMPSPAGASVSHQMDIPDKPVDRATKKQKMDENDDPRLHQLSSVSTRNDVRPMSGGLSSNDCARSPDDFGEVKSRVVSRSDGRHSEVTTVSPNGTDARSGVQRPKSDDTMIVSHRYHVESRQNFLISTTMDDPLGFCGDGASNVKILISGKKPLLRLCTSINMAMFDPFILKRLAAKRIESPSWIQSHIWPAITRGRNIAVISEAKSGKTYSYLLPLLSFVITNEISDTIPPGNEPLAIIVCPSWRTVDNVFQECQSILEMNSVRVIKAYGEATMDTSISLLSGCEVLIITPCALYRLLSSDGIRMTGMSRLHYLILEDADVLLDKFVSEMKYIEATYRKMQARRQREVKESNIPHYVLAFSRKWSNSISNFLASPIMSSPLLFCSSFFEAIVCCGVNLVPHVVLVRDRLGKLMELVRDRLVVNRHKIVIFASDTASGLEVFRALSKICKFVLFANHDMKLPEIAAVRQNWERDHPPDEQPMLVLTDASLDEMNVTDATWVVHYDIPATKKSLLGRRFSCMMNRMTEALADVTAPVPANCTSDLIITEESRIQARTLYMLLKRMSIDIPQPLSRFMYGFYESQEEKKEGVPLCSYWKAFGVCPNDYWCAERHLLLKSEAPNPRLERGGLVRVYITSVVNASNYFGRITGYQGSDYVWQDMGEQFRILNTEMGMHFSSHDSCVPQASPEIGEICVDRTNGRLLRCRVVSKRLEEGHVEIVLLDDGKQYFTKVCDIMRCPPKLSEIPPQAYEIILCFVKPVDRDQEWTVNATGLVEELISGKELTGKVILSLGRTVWVAPLVKKVRLPNLKTTVTEFDIREQLMKKKLALPNPDHMKSVLRMCESFFQLPPPIDLQANVQVPRQQVADDNPQAAPSFAFLPMDNFESVYVPCIYSPSRFYVQRAAPAHVDCLESLMDDLDDHVKKENPPLLSNLQINAYCVALFIPDGCYYRGQIIRIIESESDPSQVDVLILYLDYGELEMVGRNYLHPLPPNFIWRLPFQAIECSLSGIAPLNAEQCSFDCIKDMFKFTSTPDQRQKILLCVEAKKRTADPENPNRFCYEVELWSESFASLADELCLWGHCKEINPSENLLQLPEDIRSASSISSIETLEDNHNAEDDGYGNSNLDQPAVHLENPSGTQAQARNVVLGQAMIVELDSDEEVDLGGRKQPAIADTHSAQASVAQLKPDVRVDASCASREQDVTIRKESVPAPDQERVRHKHSRHKRANKHHGKTPRVEWSQTGEMVTLKLKISGVENDTISVNESRLTYTTAVNGQIFDLDQILYSPVTSATSTIHELYVTLKITKATANKWPRLLHKATKPAWLSVDFDRLGDSCSDSDEEICWGDPDQKRKELQDHFPAGVESSSSSSSASSNSDEDDDIDGLIGIGGNEFEPFS